MNFEVLWLTECNLLGEIPSSLVRLKKLTDLDLAINGLSGELLSSLTELPRLVPLELYNNSLTGELPARMGNLTM
ncbi:Receptor-like protein kinase HSL1 [Linum grandiflorum]